jgi:hypothetical protein
LTKPKPEFKPHILQSPTVRLIQNGTFIELIADVSVGQENMLNDIIQDRKDEHILVKHRFEEQ